MVERSCCACRTRRPKQELIRFTRDDRGAIVFDPGGKLPGRGAYVCRSQRCLHAALAKGRLAHSLKTAISERDATMLQGLVGYLGS
ncbi:MAG: YlxR family protein [Actinomycetota bacterium]|nr:YlxR family protein [Actinomycetota bacterium]